MAPKRDLTIREHLNLKKGLQSHGAKRRKWMEIRNDPILNLSHYTSRQLSSYWKREGDSDEEEEAPEPEPESEEEEEEEDEASSEEEAEVVNPPAQEEIDNVSPPKDEDSDSD